MNNLSDILDNEGTLLIFEHLTVEVHLWQIIRDSSNQIINWQLIYVNPPTLKTWNFKSLEEIKGKTTDEIFGIGASEHYMPIIKKITDENKAHTFQDYFPNLKKHFRFTITPVGEYFITTGDDITEFIDEQNIIQNANQELERRIKQRTAELKSSEAEIQTLKGIIPICSYCKNIRNDDGAWDKLEEYITRHSDAQFSHGACPKCLTKALEEAGLNEPKDS